MAKTDRSKKLRWSGFLLGLTCGVTWFAAMLPISVSGIFLYDFSRYAFSLGVVIAMASLFSADVRKSAVLTFLVGMLIGLSLWVVFLPVSKLPIVQYAFLFGFPLGLVLTVTMVILWLAGREKSGNMRIENTVSAPNRFGVGTVMVIVFAACVMLSIANRLGFSPAFTVTIGVFLTVICISQMWMHHVPRAISVGTGALLFPVAIALSWNYFGLSGHPVFGRLVKNPSDLVYMGAHLLTVGGLLGYLGGVLVAGLFLVIEYAQKMMRLKSPPTAEV